MRLSAFGLLVALAFLSPAPADDLAPQQRPGGRGPGNTGVYRDRVTPNWFAADAKFWYRNTLKGETKEFILVDAEKGERGPAFDHAKLAAGLVKAAGIECKADKLPFDDIEFGDDGKTVQFDASGKRWKCDLTTYDCTDTGPAKKRNESAKPEPSEPEPSDFDSPFVSEFQQQPRQPIRPEEREVKSPDGKWVALVRDGNVFLRPGGGGDAVQLSKGGAVGQAFGVLNWSPDSAALVAFRTEPGDNKEVHLLESSPRGGGRAVLSSRPYPLPGDKFTAYEPWVFDVAKSTGVKVETDKLDFGRPRLRWNKDGKHFTYEKVDRGHQRFRLVEVDAHTGKTRNLIDEKTETFIWTAHVDNPSLTAVTWLQKTDEIVYVSEKSGWRHLYLIDAKTGKETNSITKGEYVARGVDRIDEEKRQVWFRASGKNPDQDPYFMHTYRVNFDGTGLTALTDGNGSHTVQFSPARKYLIDTYSRVDQAPVTELRRVDDGKLVTKLEEADITDLKASGWKASEVFVSKGRDGKTDIWGIIVRPKGFDPAKKYPVIESIYAGPQGSFVPKAFSAGNRYSTLTDLGFVVVQVDGMGTANRSKAFHDVCWKNLKDAGFPDRILWHKAIAAKYPWYDVSRVGIYGTSAGGQNAMGALLFHGDFYKAAMAACGCHDNRMDKASWNEQWMGYPVGPQYAESSNVDNAKNLTGKLLLIVGELDNNVPPESTFRVADTLIKANKDFDFLMVPGMGHSNGGQYGTRRMQDFFVKHLQGVEPPDRNKPARGNDPPARQGGGEAQAQPDPKPADKQAEKPADKPAEKPADKPKEKEPTVTEPPVTFFEKYPERDRDAARKFYKKYLDVGGLSVVSADVVDDEALYRTRHIVTHMLAGRPDVLEAMAKAGTRLIIIGKDQVYTDMPEYRNHPNPTYQNERVRGTGGLGVTSFGEENLLTLATDRYDDESIGVHEFLHTIDAALGRIDNTWRQRLSRTYRSAVDAGLWKNTYAASNQAEYWAEIAQCYFDCNRVNNWNHGPVGTREQLKRYDPEGYELVRTTFNLKPADDWRYTPARTQPSVIAPPAKYKFDPFYTKLSLAREFPVLGSKKVSNAALLKANDVVRKMFAYRHDILKAMINDGARLVVLGREEMLSDLPEFKESKEKPGQDQARYLDYSADLKLMVVPEENVLGERNDPFVGRCAVVGVFARGLHAVTAGRPVDPEFDKRREKQQYELRVKRLDVDFDARLKKQFETATGKGLWKGTPAARDRVEYWAAGVEAYFDAGGVGTTPNQADHPVVKRNLLKEYDPDLFQLVEETMAYKGQVDWRVTRPEPRAGTAPDVEPIAYTVRFPAPDKHLAEVEASYPTDGRASVELMMPTWTPGFYRVENYAGQVRDLSAKTPEGKALQVGQPNKNRWVIQTDGAKRVVVSYQLKCESRSVTTNWVGDDMAVLNGGATFLTLADAGTRPHDVRLELAANWKQSMTGLDAAPDGKANHYRAADFDTLVDSPIVAGNLEVHTFEVDGSEHLVVNAGDHSGWDGGRAAADLEKVVREHRRMWGFLPFKRYVFLCAFRRGGGGLEHSNSTLVTCTATAMKTPAAYLSWLNFVGHEYFHAFNAKRLRPVELGPFDYEKTPRTSGLWVAEGLTVYYDGLLTARAGLGSPKDFLARLSGHIDKLQKTPGRLKQTLEEASLDVWTSSFSGIGGDDKTVSYYVKGPVVGFLLDAKVRQETKGAKSLDDVMKLAYKRYSGETGFTAEQFRKTAEEVAGVELQVWFKQAVASTEELDYAEALDWFGLRFAPGEGEAKAWRLEVREDATAVQAARLKAWVEPAGK